jgi:hypothetical protein
VEMRRIGVGLKISGTKNHASLRHLRTMATDREHTLLIQPAQLFTENALWVRHRYFTASCTFLRYCCVALDRACVRRLTKVACMVSDYSSRRAGGEEENERRRSASFIPISSPSPSRSNNSSTPATFSRTPSVRPSPATVRRRSAGPHLLSPAQLLVFFTILMSKRLQPLEYIDLDISRRIIK